MRRWLVMSLSLLAACAPAPSPPGVVAPPPAPARAPVAASRATPAPEYARPEHPGRLDPFAPLARRQSVPRTRRKGPLEHAPLSGLKLVAIISEVAAPRAMFLTPDGVGHLVHEGERVQGGVIEDIRNHEVEVALSTGRRVLRLHE